MKHNTIFSAYIDTYYESYMHTRSTYAIQKTNHKLNTEDMIYLYIIYHIYISKNITYIHFYIYTLYNHNDDYRKKIIYVQI